MRAFNLHSHGSKLHRCRNIIDDEINPAIEAINAMDEQPSQGCLSPLPMLEKSAEHTMLQALARKTIQQWHSSGQHHCATTEIFLDITKSTLPLGSSSVGDHATYSSHCDTMHQATVSTAIHLLLKWNRTKSIDFTYGYLRIRAKHNGKTCDLDLDKGATYIGYTVPEVKQQYSLAAQH